MYLVKCRAYRIVSFYFDLLSESASTKHEYAFFLHNPMINIFSYPFNFSYPFSNNGKKKSSGNHKEKSAFSQSIYTAAINFYLFNRSGSSLNASLFHLSMHKQFRADAQNIKLSTSIQSPFFTTNFSRSFTPYKYKKIQLSIYPDS